MLHAPCSMPVSVGGAWMWRSGEEGLENAIAFGVVFVEVDAMLLDQCPNEVVTAFAVEDVAAM